MDDSEKTREALLAEIRDLRFRLQAAETENRQADASWYEATLHAWQDSEERYRRLVEYCPDGIAVHCEGRIVFANPAMAEILGTTPAGLLGKSLWEIVHPDCWNLVRERLDRLIQKEEAVPRIEERMVRLDGSTVEVDVVALPFLYEGRQAAQILVRDISRNKWAEEALRESERRFRRITEAVTDYVYRVYLDRGKPVRTIHGSSCEKVTGYTPEEFAADPFLWIRMVPPEEHEIVHAQIRHVLAGEEPETIEHRITRKNGEELWICNTQVPHYDAAGQVVCIDGLIRDISKRKRAERERNEMQVLVQSARKHESLSVLARGIAHDFKNIVTVMSGFAAVALGKIPAEHPVAECLRHIRAAGERAIELVNRVLLFSQDRTEGCHPMRFQDAAQETVVLLDSILPPRVHLQARIAPDCSHICADPTQIHQVVMNLCTNALHAMQNGQGGTLTVELEEVRLDAPWATRNATLLPGRYVRLSVADTGCGIPPEIRDRIFEPYFTTRNGGEGTGLGLATVQGIINSYGGAITVQSEVGHGSVFRVYLPSCGSPPGERIPEGEGQEPELVMDAVVEESAGEPPGEGVFQSLASVSERPQVLLVDVDSAVLNLGQMALEYMGYRVLPFDCCEEALLTYREEPHRFDLVVAGFVFPDRSGFDFLREIREACETQPVVLLATPDQVTDREEVIEAGFDDWLEKPFSAEALVEFVKKAFASHPQKKRTEKEPGELLGNGIN
ncbi:MAG TPA: PAS domain S-box protein [Candidatus Sumerlaeota bacterium]|nr:PAS domain S-box protein [Candidatus Sumerlaeota bacterium]HPS02656.1 PAS domain S-box protein [Candidatus Sumerlaeota bacterium]